MTGTTVTQNGTILPENRARTAVEAGSALCYNKLIMDLEGNGYDNESILDFGRRHRV